MFVPTRLTPKVPSVYFLFVRGCRFSSLDCLEHVLRVLQVWRILRWGNHAGSLRNNDDETELMAHC